MNAKDLKNSILQLAIQGKLIEQREEEGTAKELLEKIEAEKKQLIKDKVIKRQKSLPEITEEEIDFDIPESWEWARLESLTYSIGNKSNQIKQSEILHEGLYPVVSQSMNRIEGYSNKENKLLEIEPLSIIVFGDHSKTLKLIDFDFIIGADGTKILVPILIYPEYLFYVLNYNVINMRDRGYSRHFQFLKEKLISIPPLEEQKRIVAKIEELMPYVDKYDAAYSEVEKLNKKFPEDMQKSILQFAIQGKLVEQREEDGTAEKLYQQIKKEKKRLIKEGKIKKTKNLPEITEDEIPFDIPENWKWVRLGEVLYKLTDGTHSTPKYTATGVPFISVKDISSGNMDFSNTKFISQEEHESLYKRCDPEWGDILLTKVGTTGIPVIVDTEKEFSLFVSVALLKFNTDLIFNKFLMYVINAPVVQIQARENTRGVGNKNWVMRDIANTIIPLPPLTEQKRIVAKIEQLVPHAKQLVKKWIHSPEDGLMD
jgi:type I restriction enzyme S subunit